MFLVPTGKKYLTIIFFTVTQLRVYRNLRFRICFLSYVIPAVSLSHYSTQTRDDSCSRVMIELASIMITTQLARKVKNIFWPTRYDWTKKFELPGLPATFSMHPREYNRSAVVSKNYELVARSTSQEIFFLSRKNFSSCQKKFCVVQKIFFVEIEALRTLRDF